MVSADRYVRWWALALVVVFAVTAYRVSLIDSMYMREDEEIAFRTTANDLGYAIWYQAEQDVHAPVWFVTFWLWQQGAGSLEFTARLYSIFLSSITLALVYQLGRRWFGRPVFGLFAIVVLGVNAYAAVYALEIRPYALVILIATVNMGLFRRWLVRPVWGRALLYGITVALMLWTHYFLAFLVVVQLLYALLFVRLNRRLLVQGASAGVAALILWLPWLPVFVNQVLKLRAIETASGDFRGLGIGSTTEPTSMTTVARLIEIVTNGQPFLYALVLVVGIVLLSRRRWFWLTVLWGIGVPAVSLIINLFASVYTQRYVTYLAVGLALALGAALAALPLRWGRVPALLVFVGLNLWTLTSVLPVHTPHRYVFQAISAAAQPGDVVVFEEADVDRLVRWQIDHYLDPALRIVSGEEAQTARRIWFITADWFNEDVEAAFRRLEATRPLQQVIGQCTNDWCYLAQLLEGPPLEAPVVFGGAVAFWGADQVEVSSHAVTARLWWRVDEPPGADYSISLRLLDEEGRLVAQHDGPIRQGGMTIQTSEMEPGRTYLDSRSLNLGDDLPPGVYELALVVYQSWDDTRLTLPDGSDTLYLDTITLR